jgi:signal transduction histidine kinase
MDALADQGNTLILSVRRGTLWRTGQQGVRVSILDNGSGISPEHLSRLFQAFYTTKGEQGTGIGLWVSKAIIKSHDGALQLRSSVRLGQSGTCFSVFLPFDAKATKADMV